MVGGKLPEMDMVGLLRWPGLAEVRSAYKYQGIFDQKRLAYV